MFPDLKGYNILDEETIKMAASMSDSDSVMHEALKLGQEYRDAGLEPIYLVDFETQMLYVTYEPVGKH